MHVYSLSLGGETEKHKEYLAVSPGSNSFPAAVALPCAFHRGVLLRLDILPLLNTFLMPSYLNGHFTSLTQPTWGWVRSLFCLLSPPHCSENLTFSKKKCTHPVLIKPRSGEQSGGAYPMEAPHMSLGEQNRRVGCHGVLYAPCS